MNRAHSEGPRRAVCATHGARTSPRMWAGPRAGVAAAESERRSADRVPISIGVRHQTIGRTALAQAGEISESGMLLAQAMDSPIELPCKCWLEFSLPGSNTQIRARAEIVRQQQRGRHHVLAVRFRSIAPSHSRMICSFVNSAAATAPGG